MIRASASAVGKRAQLALSLSSSFLIPRVRLSVCSLYVINELLLVSCVGRLPAALNCM
jgi:hypothetical protein